MTSTGVCGVLSAVVVAASAQGAPPAPLDAGETLFENVNVVGMAAPGVEAGRSVLVRDGRIAAIGAAGEVKAGDGARVVDGGGAYLMPGLADMHVHFPPTAGERGDPAWRTATLLVVNGVTTARGLAGHPAHLEFRRRVLEGELLGPTPYIAGPPLHAGVVKTAEDARAMVREQKEAGFDVIKAHMLPDPEVYDAVQAAAAEAEIPVSGHVAFQIGMDRVMAAKQQVEHLDGFVAALRGDAAAAPFGQFPPPAMLVGIPDERIEELAERMAAAGVWNTPTQALFEAVPDVKTPTAALQGKPEMRYIHDQAINAWSMQRQGLLDAEYFDEAYGPTFTALRSKIVRALRDAGAPLLAGSDSPQAFFAPGFALHDELGALVAAGLSPWEALRTATANPARYFGSLPGEGSAAGVPADFGTVEVGRRADLVLVDGDPTADIANARKIRGVMVRGKWLDRGALDGLLDEVAASVGKGG